MSSRAPTRYKFPPPTYKIQGSKIDAYALEALYPTISEQIVPQMAVAEAQGVIFCISICHNIQRCSHYMIKVPIQIFVSS